MGEEDFGQVDLEGRLAATLHQLEKLQSVLIVDQPVKYGMMDFFNVTRGYIWSKHNNFLETISNAHQHERSVLTSYHILKFLNFEGA